MFISKRQKERAREHGGKGQKARKTLNPKNAAGSELAAQGLIRGFNSDRKIMTWAKVQCLTHWATQGPLSWNILQHKRSAYPGLQHRSYISWVIQNYHSIYKDWILQSTFSYHKGIKLGISKIFLKSLNILNSINTGTNKWLNSEIKLYLYCIIIKGHIKRCEIQHKQCLWGMLCVCSLTLECKKVLKLKI